MIVRELNRALNKMAEALKSCIMDAMKPIAHPYHSSERGLDDNKNSLIRQYASKGSSFGSMTA